MTDLLVAAIVAALVSLIVALLMKPKAPVKSRAIRRNSGGLVCSHSG